MPSPFPGMDPYLEGALWTTLHHGLGSEIVRHLAPKLRPRYVALPVERFVMELNEGVGITTSSAYPAVATPPRLATVILEAVPHVSIEIRDTQQRHLVTAIRNPIADQQTRGRHSRVFEQGSYRF